MIPLCPPERALDVKKSSYKKMGKFLEAMQTVSGGRRRPGGGAPPNGPIPNWRRCRRGWWRCASWRRACGP